MSKYTDQDLLTASTATFQITGESEMSDTPRTDKVFREWEPGYTDKVFSSMRQLERELSAAQSALAQANLDKAEYDALKAMLAAAPPQHEPKDMSKPFNEQAALLIENAANLIKQVLVKHSAAVLDEMHDQIVSRNDRIKHLEAERDALLGDKDEYCEVIRVLGMEEEGSAVEEILRLGAAEITLKDLLRVEFLRHRHDINEMPWECVEVGCPRFGKSVYIEGCECRLDYERKHIAAVKKELRL